MMGPIKISEWKGDDEDEGLNRLSPIERQRPEKKMDGEEKKKKHLEDLDEEDDVREGK